MVETGGGDTFPRLAYRGGGLMKTTKEERPTAMAGMFHIGTFEGKVAVIFPWQPDNPIILQTSESRAMGLALVDAADRIDAGEWSGK